MNKFITILQAICNNEDINTFVWKTHFFTKAYENSEYNDDNVKNWAKRNYGNIFDIDLTANCLFVVA